MSNLRLLQLIKIKFAKQKKQKNNNNDHLTNEQKLHIYM